MNEQLDDFVPENLRQMRGRRGGVENSKEGAPRWLAPLFLGAFVLFVLVVFVLLVPDALVPMALLVFGVPMYILPTLIANQRNHHNALAIAALNLLLGWTFVGWALALVWALTEPKRF